MKNVLFLDANETVEDSISYAKKCGYRIITCDNIPTHVCHSMADVSYNVSTYDVAELKKIVEKESIDGVVYFASAHGLYGATRLIETYNFPGIPFRIESLFSNKKKFREFLRDNDFDCPQFQAVSSIKEIDDSKIKYPVIVKPVDSSGGNIGITKVLEERKLCDAVQTALDSSYGNVALIEDFINSDIQINGDCLICDGKLVLTYLGKYIYRNLRSILPYATIFSSNFFYSELFQKIKDSIQRLVSLSKIDSAVINVELRVGSDGRIYFIEVNPRHSGNRIYKLMNLACGVNMSAIAVQLAMGESVDIPLSIKPKGNFAYVIFYSMAGGKLRSIELSPLLRKKIIQYNQFVDAGDAVRPFSHLRDRLALALLSFDSEIDMERMVTHLEEYYQVVLE